MPRRVLILANEFITDAATSLPPRVAAQAQEVQEVLVVAPALTSRLQSLTSDVDGARADAQSRLHRIAADIGQRRAPPRTQIGDENQLTAVEDALVGFPADALVTVLHAPEIQNHRERGLADRLRQRFALPVTVLVVNASGRIINHELAQPSDSSRRVPLGAPESSLPGATSSADVLARLAPVLPELFVALRRNRGELPSILQGGGKLGERHGSVLLSLSTAGSATVSEIGARLAISSAHASLVIRELAHAGLVEREHDPDDRRRIVVSLSEDAKPALRTVRDRMDRPLQRFLSELDAREAETFVGQLKRFADILNEAS